jgi:hypothetical protein
LYYIELWVPIVARNNGRGYGEKTESTGPPKRYNYNRFQQKKGNQETKFDGRCDDIKGFVFDCAAGKQADRYNTTIWEITAYAGRTYDYGGDIRWSIKNEKKYEPTKPNDVGATATATDKRIWEKEIDEYVRRKAKLTAKCAKLYSLILGQCIEHMVAKLESLDDFKEIERRLDVIKLMKAIKGVSYQFEGQTYQGNDKRQTPRNVSNTRLGHHGVWWRNRTQPERHPASIERKSWGTSIRNPKGAR